MGSSDMQHLTGTPNYLMPSLDQQGMWGTVGGVALRQALHQGTAPSVISLLKSMDAMGIAKSLGEAGFEVPAGIAKQGRAAVFASVQGDLSRAVKLRVDGFGLAAFRVEHDSPQMPFDTTFAAKDGELNRGPKFKAGGFLGDPEAGKAIQGVLSAAKVDVDMLGDAQVNERNALVLVAGQALQKGVQGFGFDGIEGKFKIKLSMAEMAELHRGAAQAVATESAKDGLASWAKGEKPQDLSEWVPDSVQRLLYGSLSLQSAHALVNAIEGGSIARHAGEIGVHGFSTMLKDQGFDINAPSVQELANDQGLVIIEPNLSRGQYFGPVVAMDHRAALVKFTRSEVIELPFEALSEGQARPSIGDAVRLGFKAGEMTVTFAERPGREAVGR